VTSVRKSSFAATPPYIPSAENWVCGLGESEWIITTITKNFGDYYDYNYEDFDDEYEEPKTLFIVVRRRLTGLGPGINPRG